MLQNILAVTGKPGLFKLVTRGNNMLVIESLLDGKRMPSHARDKIVALADVSMFTDGEDIALSEVLTKLGEKEGLKVVAMDPKKADNEQLRAFFAEIVPNFDRDRVYPSDIRKLIQWYNILINAGITDFSIEEAGEEVQEGAQKTVDESQKKAAQKAQAKTQAKSAGGTARTGVGARKG